MPDWDAARYHRVSDPQLVWGRGVAARVMPRRGERLLDLGCGTGRVTSEVAATPDIVVIGLDRSAAMLEEARKLAGAGLGNGGPRYVQGDGPALPFVDDAFDAVFSSATFHWIADHDGLFRSIYRALKRGGRLVAQCGGAGNLQQLDGRTRTLMADERYARFFTAWSDPWRFEGIRETESRLGHAGFSEIVVALTAAPTTLAGAESYAEFIACVCLRHQLDRLPNEHRDRFVTELTTLAARDSPPFTLDYSRLNISARKGHA